MKLSFLLLFAFTLALVEFSSCKIHLNIVGCSNVYKACIDGFNLPSLDLRKIQTLTATMAVLPFIKSNHCQAPPAIVATCRLIRHFHHCVADLAIDACNEDLGWFYNRAHDKCNNMLVECYDV